MSVLIKRIHKLLKNNEHWVVAHVPRKANQLTDRIVKMTQDAAEGLIVFVKPPPI